MKACIDELVYGAYVIDWEKNTEFSLKFFIIGAFLAQSNLHPSIHMMMTFFFNIIPNYNMYIIFANLFKV